MHVFSQVRGRKQCPPLMFPASFTERFIRELQVPSLTQRLAAEDLPSYSYSDDAELGRLIQRSRPRYFTLGTGASVFTHALLPAILQAEHEVILVTCFWAQSKTLRALSRTLAELASSRAASQANAGAGPGPGGSLPTLRIRICFSSTSFFQKLFHTSSRDGYTYPPSSWPRDLDLPSEETLAAGKIELVVKSLFFLPFSVMHPKFLIVDRQRAFIPSCNVSWESWLEGCIELSRATDGPNDAVDGLLHFYRRTWENDLDLSWPHAAEDGTHVASMFAPRLVSVVDSPAHTSIALPGDEVSTIWLPSSHHRNPRFALLPWQAAPLAPTTPLNAGLLHLLDLAKRQVRIQTPNLTSPPVIAAILDALSRGVDVKIVTSCNMMLFEQIATAGTTTAWCISRLVSQYRTRYGVVGKAGHRTDDARGSGELVIDLESQDPLPGKLEILYFQPRNGVHVDEEPVHSHLKLMIVDDEYTVLGSGNLDRASWYTSQELGVLFYSTDIARLVGEAVDKVLDDRLTTVFDSEQQ